MATAELEYSNPGLNDEGGKNLKYIMANSVFFKGSSEEEEKGSIIGADIFRFAVAVAIARGLKLPDNVRPIGSSDKRPNGMSWTQSTLNSPPGKKHKSHSLTGMIEVLSEHSSAKEEPWDLIERSAHAGLKEIVKDIKEKKLLSEILDC